MHLLLQVTSEMGVIDYGLEMSRSVVPQGVNRCRFLSAHLEAIWDNNTILHLRQCPLPVC